MGFFSSMELDSLCKRGDLEPELSLDFLLTSCKIRCPFLYTC